MQRTGSQNATNRRCVATSLELASPVVTAVLPLPRPAVDSERVARPRRYLMCRPEHFDVTYAINPWMDISLGADRELAVRQWETLRSTYESLGHEVELIDPEPGLPDMVFAANGGLVVEGRALGARFTHDERVPEGPAYLRRLGELGLKEVVAPVAVNEGEGDFLVVGDLVLAGTGFRTDHRAHDEVQELFGVPVISLQLVDPRFYHLDTALAVLDDHAIAYYPEAFSPGSRAVLQRLFPDAVLATEADAVVLGLNAVSDGRHVVLPAAAHGLAEQLRERGYVPIGVDLSELLKAGGSVKCCTLEIRA
jgi:N-dimethylarginine dimethylaminohydrolase